MKITGAVLIIGLSLISRLFAQQSEKLYLSGRDSSCTVEWEFKISAGMRAGEESTINVPSCWEQQGFGAYDYGWARNYPKGEAPRSEKGLVMGTGDVKSREVGFYKYNFKLPEAWSDKRIFIVFEGVMTDADVKINGKSAGPVHQGAFTRFKYDITELLKSPEKDNTLEVEVSKMSADFSVNMAERQADYWVFGGIYRPVYLEATPLEYLDHFAVDAQADGLLDIFAYAGNAQEDMQVEAILLKNGRQVGDKLITELADVSAAVELKGRFKNIKPWTSETPELYELQVSLVKDKNIIHTLTSRIGFRTFALREGDGLYLNGKRIQLKGVNRHSFRPATARALTPDDCLEDIKLMKTMNMNAVRMSHYPPDSWFLDMCDEYGLYVLDELSGWHKPPYDTGIGSKILQEMVVRDVNHPSIIIWDNGNEGGWNKALDPLFAKYDPQNRPVIHPWSQFNGINTSHYRSYSQVEGFLSHGLYMPTEILHGQYDGGIGAGAEDYWNLIYHHKNGAGMFFWDFADEGIARSDKGGAIDTSGGHAPDGLVGPYLEKEASFYTVKEVFSPVYVLTESKDFDPAKGVFPVENRYYFTNLKACRIDWQLVKLPLPAENISYEKVLESGSLAGPDVAPFAAGKIVTPFNREKLKQADLIRLTYYAPDRHKILANSYKLHSNKATAEKLVKGSGAASTPGVVERGESISVSTGIFTFVFSKKDGCLTKVLKGHITVPFGQGPKLAISTEDKKEEVLPKNSSLNSRIKVIENSDSITLDVTGNPDFKKLKWTVKSNGWLKLDYTYSFKGAVSYMGITFSYPEGAMQEMTWRGKGPYRVWKNRKKGPQYGVWSNLYNSFEPNTAWNYPEFPGYYADFNWIKFDTENGPFTVVSENDNLYFRAYSQKQAEKRVKLVWPDGDISFLHAIPTICSKFKLDPEKQLGPQSVRFNADGDYSAELYFYFDTPAQN